MKFEEFVKDINKLFDEEVMKIRHEQDDGRLTERFRMSGIASCPRASHFAMLNLPHKEVKEYKLKSTDSAKGYKLMQQGTDGHTFIQKVLIHMGVLDKNNLEHHKRIEDNKILVSGHPDGVLTFDDQNILLEIKSINDRSFQILTEPKQEHYYQGQGYVHFLEQQYQIKIDKILFLYFNRNSDNMDFKPFVRDRDEAAINNILNKLKVMREYLVNGQIYPIPPGYNPEDPKCYACRYCPYNTKGLCRSGKNLIKDFPGARISANIQIKKNSL